MEPHAAILVIEDDPPQREALREILASEGYEVEAAPDGEAGLALLRETGFEIVLTDLALPGLGGMEVLKYLVRHRPDTLCIIVTGYATIKNSVAAMRLGAYDYLAKPVDPQELKLVIRRALEHKRLKQENLQLKQQLCERYGFANIIGTSEAITRIFNLIKKVADTDSTVLLLGESGTGKELIAKAIHYNSHRRQGPLIPVNCAAIPEELLESELFGHERGAFTHAVRTRIGRFEQANGGTIFLDEIADMSPSLQVKLLRVLQDRAFERIGGVKTIRVDIRVIAATNQNLEELVNQGRFREDLFYRLNVIPIRIPPLRERPSDIPLLVSHFLQEFSRTKKKPLKRLSPAAMQVLLRYPWPGNVRELENLMERLVILTEGEVVEVDDLPERFHTALPTPDNHDLTDFPDQGIHLTQAVQEFERRLILQALDKSHWVKSRAAQLLHLNRTTLIEKMKKQRIQLNPSPSAIPPRGR
ncbi:MAG: sigma-54-dependent Fis family transcriptional regulator [Deltaproteobacteria bacterium]|nr:sigma-54-dependent Fis family transcriptional regulator [Deltaproteobacteria bacterium]